MLIDREALEESYRRSTDSELLQIAAAPDTLTEEARQVLRDELAIRRLKETDIEPYRKAREREILEAEIADSLSATPAGQKNRAYLLPFLGRIGLFLFDEFRRIARGGN